MVMVTSTNIKTIVKDNPNVIFTVHPIYTGDVTARCKYVDSLGSITTLVNVETNEKYHILRGYMKYVNIEKVNNYENV
jgi:quinolinate synthase